MIISSDHSIELLAVAVAVLLLVVVWQWGTISNLKGKLKVEKMLNERIFPQHKELQDAMMKDVISENEFRQDVQKQIKFLGRRHE